MVRANLAGWVALAALVHLGDPAPIQAADIVELRVGCVLASNSGQETDKRLIALQPRFSRMFRYTSYNLVKEAHEQVGLGGRMGFDVPGGRYLLLIPKAVKKDGRVSLKVMLLEGSRPIVDTVISLSNHGTFFVAGPRHSEGALILSIGATMQEAR